MCDGGINTCAQCMCDINIYNEQNQQFVKYDLYTKGWQDDFTVIH
jgi:hypothetical protein